MYARYCVTKDVIRWIDGHYSDYHLEKIGQEIKKNKFNEDETLNEIYRTLPAPGGSLNMDKIIKEWFPVPDEKPDIFISHSHKDEKEIYIIVGFLKKFFNLNCFVDSWNWGYYLKLLKIIDNKYCYNKKNNVYSYELRNTTTSLLSVSLLVSLQKIMDEIECSFFIDSTNSVIKNLGRDHINEAEAHTSSVWIYAEHMAMSMLRVRKPERTISIHANSENLNEMARDRMGDKLPTTYFPMDIENIPSLNGNIFTGMVNSTYSYSGNVLDILYKSVPDGIPK